MTGGADARRIIDEPGRASTSSRSACRPRASGTATTTSSRPSCVRRVQEQGPEPYRRLHRRAGGAWRERGRAGRGRPPLHRGRRARRGPRRPRAPGRGHGRPRRPRPLAGWLDAIPRERWGAAARPGPGPRGPSPHPGPARGVLRRLRARHRRAPRGGRPRARGHGALPAASEHGHVRHAAGAAHRDRPALPAADQPGGPHAAGGPHPPGGELRLRWPLRGGRARARGGTRVPGGGALADAPNLRDDRPGGVRRESGRPERGGPRAPRRGRRRSGAARGRRPARVPALRPPLSRLRPYGQRPLRGGARQHPPDGGGRAAARPRLGRRTGAQVDAPRGAGRPRPVGGARGRARPAGDHGRRGHLLQLPPPGSRGASRRAQWRSRGCPRPGESGPRGDPGLRVRDGPALHPHLARDRRLASRAGGARRGAGQRGGCRRSARRGLDRRAGPGRAGRRLRGVRRGPRRPPPRGGARAHGQRTGREGRPDRALDAPLSRARGPRCSPVPLRGGSVPRASRPTYSARAAARSSSRPPSCCARRSPRFDGRSPLRRPTAPASMPVCSASSCAIPIRV